MTLRVLTGRRKRLVDEKIKQVSRTLQEKVTISSLPKDIPVASQGPAVLQNYFRLPVTDAIPHERLANLPPDDRHRWTKKFHLRGVSLRFMLHFSRTVEAIAVCYPARVQRTARSIMVSPQNVGDVATQFQVGVPVQGVRRMLTLGETNMASYHGPFAVRTGDNAGVVLDNVDDSLFTTQLARHDGGPVGKVSWKSGRHSERKGKTFKETYHIKGLMRTQNWNDAAPATNNAGQGYVQSDSIYVQVYFDIQKDLRVRRPITTNMQCYLNP